MSLLSVIEFWAEPISSAGHAWVARAGDPFQLKLKAGLDFLRCLQSNTSRHDVSLARTGVATTHFRAGIFVK